MPLDVLGRTRATLKHSTSPPRPTGLGNLLKLLRDGDRLLQLLIFNEEFLVSACHQRALITSLPFVHTARRSYRLNDPVRPPDWGDAFGSPDATLREAVQTLLFRGRRSRNKVSVGEPAEGSLPVSSTPTAAHCLLTEHFPRAARFPLWSRVRPMLGSTPRGGPPGGHHPNHRAPCSVSGRLTATLRLATPPLPSVPWLPLASCMNTTHNSCRWISWLSQR